MKRVRDLVIIGSGPAGLTAAIYAARANLEPLVLEGEHDPTGNQPGGQLMLTTEVENFPGFVDGIQGPDLIQAMRDQASRFGAEFLPQRVNKLDFSTRPFAVWTDGEEFGARAVIISTGARSLMLGLEGERRLLGRGVSTCATCDGFFFRGQDVAVVGGGDSAMEEAVFLTKFASRVTIIHRRDELRASKIMQERAFQNDRIDFLWGSEVVALEDENRLEAAIVRKVGSGIENRLSLAGCFVAIGHAPNTDIFRGQLEMDESGYVLTGSGTRTNVEGVFACGDVQDRVYRQAITAAGSGCMAAIDAERWLETVPHKSKISETTTNW